MSTDLSEFIEELKDIAYQRGLVSLRGTIANGGDSWTTIEVRHAALMSDSKDGWDVIVKESSL